MLNSMSQRSVLPSFDQAVPNVGFGSRTAELIMTELSLLSAAKKSLTDRNLSAYMQQVLDICAY